MECPYCNRKCVCRSGSLFTQAVVLIRLCRDFEVTFPDAKYAQIACNTVRIDEDVKADRIYKHVSVVDNIVKVYV